MVPDGSLGRGALAGAVRWVVLASCVALAGCSTVVAGRPTHSRIDSGPIHPSQLDELLTPSSAFSVVRGKPLVEQDMQTALFVGADPAECQGVAGYGRYPLFPKDYTGREARTQDDDGRKDQHQLLEVSATYPGTFDAVRFLDSVRQTVSGCQHPVTAWGDDRHKITVNPGPLTASSPEVVHWTTNLVGEQWICDFAVIAKANVIAQIVTCSPTRSIDVQPLVTKRLRKIGELLNSTA